MIVKYTCEVCGEEWDTERACMKCEARTMPPQIVSVGAIVTTNQAGYGWFDGDSGWIVNQELLPYNIALRRNPAHGNCFDACCTLMFYYVVTLIDQEKHKWRYHLRTLATTGSQGHESWFTYDERGSRTMRVVENPPAHVIESSRVLIGTAARCAA